MAGQTDAQGYLEELANRHASLAESLGVCNDLYARKLWHQLTGHLEGLFGSASFTGQVSLVEMYTRFVLDFVGKLNPLRACLLAVDAARQVATQGNVAGARDFLLDMTERVQDPHALLVVKAEQARVMVHSEELRAAKELAEECKAQVDRTTGLDSRIHSAVYRAMAELYKKQNKADEFYKAALLFLSYTPTTSEHDAGQMQVAFDIAIAALVGDNIFNYGELVQHPLIQNLATTEHKWLFELLDAFNNGDIEKYDSISGKYRAKMAEQPALLARAQLLNEKIRIMALVDLVFRRPADERALPFAAIATHCKLSEDQVEMLVMRSISLKLLRGAMDQVDAVFRVTWVQPRVLDTNQAAVIKGKLGSWAESLQNTAQFLEAEFSA